MDSYYYYCYYSVLVWYCWDDGSNQSLGNWSMTLLLLFVVSLQISMVCGFPLQRFYSMSGGAFLCIDPVSTDREWRYHLYTLVDITHGLNTEWKTETIVSRTRVRSTIGSTGYGVGHCAKRDDRESIYCSLSRTSPFADSYRYSIFATATTASTW